MARKIFIINIFAFIFSVGYLQAQSFWRTLENEIGLCEVDSINIANQQYYQLLDTIEHYWDKCEIDGNPCYAIIYFSDTNRIEVVVKQLVEIWSLVIRCYQKKIYGAFCYHNHYYFVLKADSSLIDKDALLKSPTTTFSPPFFSSQIYDSLTLNSNFLVREENKEQSFIYPPTPFDFEWKEEKYDNIKLELILNEDNITCMELESCILKLRKKE